MLDGILIPFVPNAAFLYHLKTSENRKVFRYFQGVQKGWIGNKWVKCNSEYSHNVTMLLDFLDLTFFIFCLFYIYWYITFSFSLPISYKKVSTILVVQVRLPVIIRQENSKLLHMLYLFIYFQFSYRWQLKLHYWYLQIRLGSHEE